MLEHVKFDLFDFQEEEVERLHPQKSRLIAWEMGTGKTYAGIALDQENRGRSIEHHGNTGPLRKTLIICPKSVRDVWDAHTMDLTDEDVYVIDPKNRQKFIDVCLDPNRDGYFICHYEAIRLMPELRQVPFFHIITDECHRIKNRKAQQTRAAKGLKALYRTALSGTPADNKPHDLWSVLNWLWPKVYTSYWNFYKAYIVSETTWEGYRKIVGVKNIDKLREQMRPWYSRKLKKEVLKDLPDKYYTDVWVDLGPKQRKAYDQMQRTMVAWVEDLDDEFKQSPLIAQAVIAQLVRLQQFALGYMVPTLDGDGAPMYRPDRQMKDGSWKPGTQIFHMIEPSAKLDALMEMIEDNEDEQFVVFSQQKQILPLLAARLEAKGITHGIFTGDTKDADRKRIISDFQAGDCRIFAGTIAAGGVGITLTAASTVVFLDRGWSPAINEQAEDRLHRIGQKNAVQVIDIMAKSTVDIGRREMLDQKSEWLHTILGDEIIKKLRNVPMTLLEDDDETLD